MGVWEKIQRLLDRTESRVTLWIAIVGSPVVGLVTGWVAWVSQQIGGYGPIGWWMAGLLGAFFFAATVALIAYARYRLSQAAALRQWRDQSEYVNPLDREYHNKRINIGDIAHPISGEIKDKVFVGCELIGPANIFFQENIQSPDLLLGACDIVILRDNGPSVIHNVLKFKNVKFINTGFFRCTLFASRSMLDEMPIERVVTFSGVTEFDSKVLEATQTKGP